MSVDIFKLQASEDRSVFPFGLSSLPEELEEKVSRFVCLLTAARGDCSGTVLTDVIHFLLLCGRP